MLNFKRFTLLFFIFLLGFNLYFISGCPNDADFLCSHKLLIYAVLIFLYFTVSFTMAFSPCSGFHHKVVCKGNQQKKWISLTFDDGPEPECTSGILEVLKRQGVNATFFLTGTKIEQHPELVKAINLDGHIVGNHTFSHSVWFDFFSTRRMVRELRQTNDLIRLHTGKTPRYFRPPYGVINPMLSRALAVTGLLTVCWNQRSFDTVSGDSSRIMKKLIRNLKPGSIILLHERTPFVRDHLEALIRNITEQGFEIKPLPELIQHPAYE